MNYTYLHYQIGMTLLVGVGPVRARMLLTHFPNIEEFFQLSPSELARKTGFKTPFVREMRRDLALEKALEIANHMEVNSIQSVFFTEPNFPRRLNTCSDGPLLLYSVGNFNYNSQKTVAVVGTRGATPYGRALCRTLIESFQDKGISVVSGLALGIDACAHQLCLEFGVPTIGVLGHGLDRIYPAVNRSLASKMLAHGGLVTEFIPGTDPDRENFPKRNRIVAGLSDATIVVESKRSGGSLITAQLANEYSRDVFAFPGNVDRETSLGCNELIATQQAHLLSSPEAFLEMMGWTETTIDAGPQRAIFQELSADQQRIVEVLAQAPGVQIDVLAMKTSLPITALNVELFQLEMGGVIRALPGRAYSMA